MAAITATAGNFRREASAQATTGQTDWINVPSWARYISIFFNLTAVAGNTPISTLSLKAADPVSRDDAHVINIAEHAALTGITAAGQYILQVGPGVTGIADDVTNSATADSVISLNAVLPQLLGVTVLNDRTTGDETYTYNLSVTFRA
jgi:hypothetical protein